MGAVSLVGVLVVQFVLGRDVNLFAALPVGSGGAAITGGAGMMMGGMGLMMMAMTPPLMAHMMLGLLVAALAAVYGVVAVASGQRRVVFWATMGAVAVLVAGYGRVVLFDGRRT